MSERTRAAGSKVRSAGRLAAALLVAAAACGAPPQERPAGDALPVAGAADPRLAT
jgi:hypothetical protein